MSNTLLFKELQLSEVPAQPVQALVEEQGGTGAHSPLIATVRDGFEPLSPYYVTLERRVGYVVFSILTLIGTIFAIAVAVAWWNPLVTVVLALAWFAMCLLFLWAAHFWPAIKARHVSWRLSDEGMEIRTGVWWRHRIAIPVARVQHVDVSQGPIQRLFDLGTLEIHTAGTKNASVQLEGLEHSRAMHVRDELIAQKESLHEG